MDDLQYWQTVGALREIEHQLRRTRRALYRIKEYRNG